MHSLPWLLVRAPLVWPIVLGAIVAFAIAIAFLRSRLSAVRAVRAARDRIGVPGAAVAQPSEGMRVTLTGIIEVEGAPCQRFEDGNDAAAASAAYTLGGRRGAWLTGVSVRADDLSLRVADKKIALEGPIEVLAGSHEVQRGEPLSRMSHEVQDRIADRFILRTTFFRDHVTALRSIASGDLVRVSGVLRRDASASEGGGYRGAIDRWKLLPEGDEALALARSATPRGLLVAFEGAARVEGPRIGWYRKHVVAGVAIGIAALSLGGELAFAIAKNQLKKQPNGVGALYATSLAAITPWRREAALRSLANAMDVHHEEDAALIERRAALHEISGDHRAAAEALARHGFLDSGAHFANDHGEHLLAAQLFYATGHFERASRALQHLEPSRSAPNSQKISDAKSRFAVRVHLLAGHPDLAAKSAHELYESRRSRLEKHPEEAEGAALAHCLHYALDQRSDYPKLHVSPTPSYDEPVDPVCAVLLADLRQGKERLDMIRGFTGFQTGMLKAPMRWLKLLEQEADSGNAPGVPLDATGNPSFLVINPTFAVHAMIPGLERAIAEAPPKDVAFPERHRATRASAAALAATFAASTGDYESARRFAQISSDHAKLVDEIYPPGRGCVSFVGYAPEDPFDSSPDRGAWTRARAAALSAAIELSAGAVAQASELLAAAKTMFPSRGTSEIDALIRYRSERNLELESFFTTWHIFETGMARPLAMAAEGDGAALAAWLRKPTSEAGSFLRLGAPLLQTGKDELARWIRLGYRVPDWTRSTSAQAVYWSDLAGVATAIGEEALAGTFRERASRFRAALLRRDLAVPLAVVEKL